MNILLVEDDPGIGRFLSRGLVAEGHEVDWLRAGRDVQASLRQENYAAAILDLGLPDIDGMELCRSLRAAGVETPILMLTARDSLDDKLDGFRSGADDYLSKPFAFEELLARLNVMARRGDRGGALAVGGLRIDLRGRSASLDNKPLGLPRRELDVLISLARRPGEVVSRERILDEAWGEAKDIAPNTVDVYVGYLRRRLAALDGAPKIDTVRGLGFRITG